MGCTSSTDINSYILDIFYAEESNDYKLLRFTLKEFEKVYNPDIHRIDLSKFSYPIKGVMMSRDALEFITRSMMVNAVLCGREQSVKLLKNCYPVTLQEITTDFVQSMLDRENCDNDIIYYLLKDTRVNIDDAHKSRMYAQMKKCKNDVVRRFKSYQ